MIDAEPAVLTERRERVLVITINRPEQRNAVNAAVAEGIAAALDELDGDAELSIGVITGAGKGFCAGMDLKAFVTGERPWAGDRGFAGITQRSAAKPIIYSPSRMPTPLPTASNTDSAVRPNACLGPQTNG